MIRRPRNKLAETDQCHVCDIFVEADSAEHIRKEGASQIFELSLHPSLGGVKLSPGRLELLFDGRQLPVFVSGTQPELVPITIQIKKQNINAIILADFLHRRLRSHLFHDIRIDGQSIYGPPYNCPARGMTTQF